MKKFALINDNMIADKREAEQVEDIYDRHQFQQVIDITDFAYEPQIGWVHDKGLLYMNCPNVTPRQVRQALVLSGVNLNDLEAALETLPEPTRTLAKIEWEYSNMFERRRPLVAAVAQMLGWNEQQLDQLWLLAGKL